MLVALEGLANFPRGTRFRGAAAVDRCALLSAEPIPEGKDPRSPDLLLAAAWDDDLLALRREGAIEGLIALTEYEHDLFEYLRFRRFGFLRDGKVVPFRPPRPRLPLYEEADDVREGFVDLDTYRRHARVSQEGLSVTAAGWTLLEAQPPEPLAPPLTGRVERLLEAGDFDVAVREAGVLLETRLRGTSGSRAHGQALVRDFVASVVAREGRKHAFTKIIEGELRTLFRFVRNEFAHNLVAMEEPRCRAILRRFGRVFAILDELDGLSAA
ncbi:MAG: hypothetical protein QOE90_2783 [Thermoplasmata archaeon]|jgi:hypothetical protein|nr:hypothetical protein [Thermoplasmata archaeon]